MITPVSEAQVAGKRVLVRVDYNEPVDGRGRIQDDFRMRMSLPTLELLRKQKPKEIILITHLGNPVVRPGETLQRTMAGNRLLRLEPIADHLASLLGIDESVSYEEMSGSPLPVYRLAKDVIMLENIRFHQGEHAADEGFGKLLAALGDVYVNEAFSVAHRADTSLVVLPKLMPSYGGLRLLEEVENLRQLTDQPPKPTLLVLGGAKVLDKITMIDALLKKVHGVLLGGVMANTFLAAQGADLKKSVVETERLALAKDLLSRAPHKFILPLDFVWERDKALDIGPQTAALFARHIAKAQLVFWNGPMGWTAGGKERFYRGSKAVAAALAATEAKTVIAGGDTLEVVNQYDLADKMTFCSTGGGAALAYVGEQGLPGLTALEG